MVRIQANTSVIELWPMARTMLAEQKIAQYLKLRPYFTQLTSTSEQTLDQKEGKRPTFVYL